ncbi:hypothetical protein NPIRD3C_2001 [Nitrosopumilus piranensis]|uniref:Uncharacterized protein n=1 Tax=Nitrosopumilus piranensis TaxID=1582439 RepID=A0A0C5BY16_9ARCH|nr:hypothetical protein NPIRD3C_2001 [Nitrosopumilus piranensis]
MIRGIKKEDSVCLMTIKFFIIISSYTCLEVLKNVEMMFIVNNKFMRPYKIRVKKEYNGFPDLYSATNKTYVNHIPTFGRYKR